MPDEIDSFLDAKPDDIDSFLEGKGEGSASSVAVGTESPAGLLSRANEGITAAAVRAAKPIAAPVDAAIKKVDEKAGLPDIQFTQQTSEGSRQGSLVPELIGKAVGAAVGKVVSTAADQLEIPEIAQRPVKDFTAGAIQLGSGIAGAMRAVGFENTGELIAKSAQETAKNLMPPDPNILDQVAQGLGSMSAFMIPGIGISTSAGAVATVAPRLAMFLGTATSTVLEAGTEAGEVYNRVMDKTGDKAQASTAAGRSFWANIPLIHYTNKLGWAGEQASRASRAFESFLTEGLQEGSQELIGNFAANDPLMRGVLEAAFVGGLTGGISGAVAHGPVSQLQQDGKPPEGAPPPPPPAPPATPAAPTPAPFSDAPAPIPLNTVPIAPATPPAPAAPVVPAASVQPAPAPVQAPTPETAPAPAPLPTIPNPEEIVGKKKPSKEPKAPKAEKKGKKPKAGEEEVAPEDAAPEDDEEAKGPSIHSINKAQGQNLYPIDAEITFKEGKKELKGVVKGHGGNEDGFTLVAMVGGKKHIVSSEELGVKPTPEAIAAKKKKDDAEAASEKKWKDERDAKDAVAISRLKELKVLYEKAQAAPKEQRRAIADEYAKLYEIYDESAQDSHYYSRDSIREASGFSDMPPSALLYRQTTSEKMDKSPEFKAAVKEAVEASSSRREFREKLSEIVLSRDIPVSRMLLGELVELNAGASADAIDARSIYGMDTLGGSEFSGQNRIEELKRVSEPMLKKMKEAPVSKERAALVKQFAAKLEAILPDSPRKGKKKPGMDDITKETRAEIVEAVRIGEISEDVAREIIESGTLQGDGSTGLRGTIAFKTADSRITIAKAWKTSEFEVSQTNKRLMAKARAIDLKQKGLPPTVNAQSKEKLVDWIRESTVGWRGTEENLPDVEFVIDNFAAPVQKLVKLMRSWKHSGRHMADTIVRLRGEGVLKELGWPTTGNAAYIQRHNGHISTFDELMDTTPRYAGHSEDTRDSKARDIVDSYDPITDAGEIISELELEVKEAEQKAKEATKKAEKALAERELKEAKESLKETSEILAKPGAVTPDAPPIEYADEEVEEDVIPEVASVEDAVAQLEKAGYDLKTAKTLSTVFEGFRVLAERAGVSAAKLFDKYGIRIVKGELVDEEGDKFLDQKKTLLRSWFGKSKVVDEKGKPLVVFHGTTNDFTTFDKKKANLESDFGAGFYFSNTQEDVAANYAGEGPDLQNKIETEAEHIFQSKWDTAEDEPKYGSPEYKAAMDEARAEARSRHSQHGGATIPVYLKMENPFIVGGLKETMLSYELVLDESGDIVDEKGPLLDFIQALRDEASNYEGGDVDALISKLLEEGGDVRAQDLYKLASETDGFGYFEDQNGRLVSKEIIRAALERAGFDGIIDNTVNVKFGSQKRIGKAMEGMRVGTVHYIAFNPANIKSALGSKYGPGENILEQGALTAPPFYHKLQRDIEAKLPEKATVEQVRAILRDSKAEEVEWSGIEGYLRSIAEGDVVRLSLGEKAQGDKISKKELLAYLKLNELQVKEVKLGEKDDDAEFQQKVDEAYAREMTQFGGRGMSREEIEADLAETAGRDTVDSGGTKFGEYTLPGGENYKELLSRDEADRFGRETLAGIAQPFEAHSMEITEKLADAANREGFSLFQKSAAGEARGRIRISLDREFTIELLENADLSTFLHEAGHLYLEVMGDIVNESGASQSVKDDYATILSWLGVKTREEIATVHHEKFARGFEAYLMEGKAPTTRLQAAFDQFRIWLGSIYKQLTALEVELTPEVRRVFDRMLATDSEIAAGLKDAEEALSRANRLKNETEAQGPPAQPQDAAPAAKAAVVEAKAKVKKAKEKAKPVAKQAVSKAADEKGARIEGIKRSILESFEYDARDLKDSSPRTWLKPAQLERYAKAGLLHPSEFTPTPLAKKAVAELQRVKAIMAKGYIDKPGLVEPKRLTLKGVLKNIADMGRFALFNLAPEGWMTDGHILFKLSKEDDATLATFLPMAKNAGQPPKIDFLLTAAERATDPVIGVIGAADAKDGQHTYLLETEGGRRIVVNASFYNFMKERFPDAKLLAERPDTAIKLEQQGQIVGFLMPMRGSEDARLLSVETGEEIVRKTVAGRAEVDAKASEAEKVRQTITAKRLVLKNIQADIDHIDRIPGDKKEAAISKSAMLQNDKLKAEQEISELEKEVANIEEQAAALREQHGIQDIPVSGLVRKRPKGGKGGGKGASSGDFAFDTPVEMGGMEHIKPFRMPELVRLAYELMGKVPEVGGLNSYNGYFKAGLGSMEIRLNPIIFQNPEQAAKTLAHEIGHLIDYLPNHTLKRGNLLGSLQSLHSHLANTYGVLQVTNKQLREELMAVTEYWRPYDKDASSASYLAYRKSARELYADAISMLFNSPGTLERMAPHFYREFFAGLDRKADVKLAFFQLQAFLNQPELQIQEAREIDRRAMYLNAEDLWKQKRAEKEKRDSHYGEWLKQMLVDKHQKVIGEVEAAASKGMPLPRSRDPRYILEEMSLADNANHAFLEEVDAKVVRPMTDAELSHLDMGDYLYLTRVANGDRQAFANPKGYHPEEAQKALDFMKGRLGPDRFAKLEAAAGAFRDIIFAVSQEAVEVGAYNKEVFEEKIVPNKGTYAVFAVQEYLEDYVTAGVKEQVGTLKDIANPFTATVMKVVGLNRLIAKQKGANAVRDFLLPRGEATKAEVVARGDKLTQFRAKKGFGLLEVLENGRPAAYYVDPYIAEAFERKDAGTFHLAVKLLDSVFNGVFRPLYITFNLGFQMFSNPIRDFSRTRRNVYALVQNQGYAGTVKSLLVEYARSLGAAGRRAAGVHDNLVSEMIANKALDITFTDYTFDPDADQYTSVLRKMGLAAPQQDGLYDRASKMVVLKPIIKTLEAIRFMGNTFESISKIAGYRMLKADSLATLDKAIAAEKDPATKARYQSERALLAKGQGEFAHEVAYNTRNFVGTPNWRRKGTVTSISNTIFPFSNIMIQGYRSDLDIATRPNTRTGFMLDMTITQLLPKLLMLFGALGGAGDELEEFFRKVSEYDKSNYIIIPVGWETSSEGKRKAVYARIPHDETGRLTAAVFWKMANAMRGDPAAIQQIIDFGAGQMPKLAPPLTIGATWVAYLSGKNPYDDFRGRPILPEKVFKAGGTYALGRMVQWTMNTMGLSAFSTHDDSKKSTAEAVLEMTPAINRIIKISDYGEREVEMRSISEKQAEDARRSLDRGPAAKAYTLERYILSQKLATGEISTEERTRLARLNKYYSVYEAYSNSIKRARAKGDPDKALHYEEKLDEILAKVVQ